VVCIDDEIPYKLPFGWTWCRLNELGIYRKGPFGSSLTKSMFVPKSKHSIKVYEQKNAIQKDYRLGEYYISKDKFSEMQSFVTHPSDIIVSCAGTIGETYFLPQDAPIGIINQALMRVRLYNLDIVDYWQLFFAYILLIEKDMKGAGSAIKNIPSFEYLKGILVPLPPLQEQKRIIEKYNEVAKFICYYTQQKEKLDLLNDSLYSNIQKSILQEAIKGKLVPQDPNDEPASVLLQRIKEEKLRLVKEGKLKKKDVVDSIIYKGDDNKYYEQVGKNLIDITDEIPFEIPNNWIWTRIGYLFAHNNGKQLNKSNSVGTLMEYITTSNLYWDGFRLENLKRMPFEENEIERCQAIKGDLLVCEGGDVGRSCIWTNNSSIMLQNHIHKLRAYLPLCTKYFFYIFYMYNLFGLIGGKGIGIQGFSSKALHNTIVPLPPLKQQKRIVKKIEVVFNKIKGD
jgi:type I restriction enzyme S subunit